ncbi:MAG TPA: DUF72 domain-containing protein [Gemmatimonadales bacterium]|nr:DUF72 domain-containing protein [Gemmatimonadales bacterium]
MTRIVVGTSGWDYPGWRGLFYPARLPRRAWLAYASRHFNSIELNGTFYSLKSPGVFASWARAVPGRGFVFAVKGSRYLTHQLELANPAGALANFFASGVLALGRKCGPFLWQLPPGLAFDLARLEAFLASLPRDSQSAARLARRHHRRLRYGALAKTTVRVRYRHALEVRHASFACEECYDLLRAYRTALVTADTAGRYPCLDQPTADFAYLRLHGSRVLYASGYSDRELAAWADRIAGRAAPAAPGLCVFRQ